MYATPDIEKAKMSKYENLYFEVLGEMLIDCESRHYRGNFLCNCREDATELLDSFVQKVIEYAQSETL